jgi:hypothetical protein
MTGSRRAIGRSHVALYFAPQIDLRYWLERDKCYKWLETCLRLRVVVSR